MKTALIISSFIFLLSSTAFAQLTPGSYVVGGSARFQLQQQPSGTAGSKMSSFSISPTVGKFVSEKYLIEGGVSYGFNRFLSSNSSADFTKRTINTFGLNVGATRFIPLVDRLYFTIGGNLSPIYANNHFETSSFGVESESRTSSLLVSLSANVGLTYFVNEKWMLFASVGALNYLLSYDLETDEVGHSLRGNITSNSFAIGARYIIHPKGKK